MRSALVGTILPSCSFLLLGAALHAHVSSHADPRVWRSDIRVGSIDVTETKPGGAISARIVIGVIGEDPARETRVEVLLPIGVAVLRIAEECRPSPSPIPGLNARVTCELGDVSERRTREIVITTTPRTTPVPLRFAVFAFSDTPDPEPTNNFAERMLR